MFIGIDYEKVYSVYCVRGARASNFEAGRIDHAVRLLRLGLE